MDITIRKSYGQLRREVTHVFKEGKSFINSITDDNMKTQVADAAGLKAGNQNNQNANIPRDKSVFDIPKPDMA